VPINREIGGVEDARGLPSKRQRGLSIRQEQGVARAAAKEANIRVSLPVVGFKAQWQIVIAPEHASLAGRRWRIPDSLTVTEEADRT
jgi:hypothetical protein